MRKTVLGFMKKSTNHSFIMMYRMTPLGGGLILREIWCVYLVWHTFISSNKWEGFYSTDAFYETGQCFIAGDMIMVKGLDWTKKEYL